MDSTKNETIGSPLTSTTEIIDSTSTELTDIPCQFGTIVFMAGPTVPEIQVSLSKLGASVAGENHVTISQAFVVCITDEASLFVLVGLDELAHQLSAAASLTLGLDREKAFNVYEFLGLMENHTTNWHEARLGILDACERYTVWLEKTVDHCVDNAPLRKRHALWKICRMALQPETQFTIRLPPTDYSTFFSTTKLISAELAGVPRLEKDFVSLTLTYHWQCAKLNYQFKVIEANIRDDHCYEDVLMSTGLSKDELVQYTKLGFISKKPTSSSLPCCKPGLGFVKIGTYNVLIDSPGHSISAFKFGIDDKHYIHVDDIAIFGEGFGAFRKGLPWYNSETQFLCRSDEAVAWGDKTGVTSLSRFAHQFLTNDCANINERHLLADTEAKQAGTRHQIHILCQNKLRKQLVYMRKGRNNFVTTFVESIFPRSVGVQIELSFENSEAGKRSICLDLTWSEMGQAYQNCLIQANGCSVYLACLKPSSVPLVRS